MLGLGYGHPKWAHGLNHGELAVEREDIVLADVDVRQQQHLHVQALCDVTCREADGRVHQRPRRAGAAGARPACAVRVQVDAGFRAMSSAAPAKRSASGWSDISPALGRGCRVRDLARIPGGASRETYRFDAEIGGKVRGMILRRDPVGGLIDTDRQTEFLAYQSFHGIVPVPEPLVLETEGGALERPFFIMSRIDGGQVPSVMNLEPYGEHAGAIGAGIVCDPRPHRPPRSGDAADQRVSARRPPPTDCWREALDDWQQRDRARRAPPAADRPRRDPPAAPQSAAAGRKDLGRAWRLSLRQFPA